jgi:hypothetical protein
MPTHTIHLGQAKVDPLGLGWRDRLWFQRHYGIGPKAFKTHLDDGYFQVRWRNPRGRFKGQGGLRYRYQDVHQDLNTLDADEYIHIDHADFEAPDSEDP